MSTTTTSITGSTLPPRPEHAGPSLIRRVLAPLASLRLTVVLLTASMLVVFAGTSAQKEFSLYEVLGRYFYSWGVWIPLKHLFPLWSWGWVNLKGGFPFPGGYTLILLLLANLIAAHSLRFKSTWKDLALIPIIGLGIAAGVVAQAQGTLVPLLLLTAVSLVGVVVTAVLHGKRTGVLLIHFSLILLLVGELLMYYVKKEDRLTFREGDTRQWVEDIQDYELAVIDSAPTDKNNVVVVPKELLETGATVSDGRLPFDVKVEKWYPNSSLAGPRQPGAEKADRLATAGMMPEIGVVEQPRVTGVEGGAVDAPSAFVTLTKGGTPLGTYAVSIFPPLDEPQEVTVDGKTYGLALRFEREYLPYKFHLIDFAHDKHVGTGDARNFSSRVRLIDEEKGVDREVVIRMNEPLRYRGHTFFQASFNPDVPTETTLQAVDNPAWLMPYAACVIGAIGLVVHFGLVLVNFLRKRAKVGELPGFSAAPPAAPAAPVTPAPADRTDGKRRKGKKGGRDGDDDDDGRAYTLRPKYGRTAVALPAAMIALALMYLLSHALRAPRADAGEFDVYALAKVPVLFEGRVLPLDTVARSSLKIISGRQSIKTDDGRVAAIQWLTDVMANTPQGDQYKVFRIDHPQIKDLLKLDHDEKLFSFEQILLRDAENGAALDKQVKIAGAVPAKRRDLYQRKITDLVAQLRLHMKLSQVGPIATLEQLWGDPERAQALAKSVEAMSGVDRSALTAEQRAQVEQLGRMRQQVERLRMIEQDEAQRVEDLYFVPPSSMNGTEKYWGGLTPTLGTTAGGGATASVPAEMKSVLGLMRAYREGDVAAFNRDVAAYRNTLAQRQPAASGDAAYETFFNRFDPFTISIVFYVGAFLFVVSSWLGWTKPLWRTAVCLLLLAFAVHTVGLVMRIQISGRPPVTTLYSSAIFIAWGVVVLALGLEWVFRNGLGIATSAVAGFLSLLVADGLGNMEGDTMKPLQAVLDTNFWLATHVVCITLGYAAVFLAGTLAIFYVIGGVFTRALADAERRRSIVRMTYGILCFAILFSFVGTILGGIWADQSWGRFWGWDPKENGAVLIVLWVAVVLHARWGGVAKSAA